MLVETLRLDKVQQLQLTIDTAAYASGDVIADTQELPEILLAPYGIVRLRHIQLIDKADQKAACTVVFLRANRSLGTENAAPNISDANAEDVIGHVALVAGDYVDLGGVSVATKNGLDLLLAGNTGSSRSLWVGLISGGTPTYGAADALILRLGVERVQNV